MQMMMMLCYYLGGKYSFMNSYLCFSVQATLLCEAMAMLDSKHEIQQIPTYRFILLAMPSFVMIAKPVTGCMLYDGSIGIIKDRWIDGVE